MLRPTVSRPCLSWCQSPIWESWADFCYCRTAEGLLSGAPALTTELVCSLQLLLVLPAQSLSGRNPMRNYNIFLSHTRNSLNLEVKIPVLYPPRISWFSYTSRHWVPFLSFLTTRSVTVEIFERPPWGEIIDSPLTSPVYNISARTSQKTPLICCFEVVAFLICWGSHETTAKSLQSNGRCCRGIT
jgi:hypothetical protein